MALKLSELMGVTPEISNKLHAAGLNDSDKLLAAVAQPQSRAEWAQKLDIDERVLLELGNRADLARIKGIGKIYSDLLEYAGVDTIMELRNRNPDNLYEKINEVADHHMVQRRPTRQQVHDWVAQAKEMERAIYY